jgi:hypothetical protein
MIATWTVQDKAQPVNYLTGALSIAVATAGVASGRRPAAAPKSRAGLACGGSHEDAWVIVPAGAAASIIW